MPFLRDPLLDSDERSRRLVVSTASLCGIPAAIFYGFISADSSALHASMCWALAVTLVLVYLRSRRGMARLTLRIAMTMTVATLAVALVTDAGNFSLTWIAVLPIVGTFYFGRGEGLLWSLGILAVFMLLLLQPQWFGVADAARSWPWHDTADDFAIAYLLISAFAASYEWMRKTSAQRAQAAIESHLRVEARLADFNRIGTDLLFELDADLLVTHVSGAWAHLTGLRGDETQGRHFSDSSLLADGSGWDSILTRLQDREPVRDMRVEFTRAHGDPVHLLVRADPLFDLRGRFLGYRGVAVDITEQTLAQQELLHKNRALQQASKMEAVGQLTSGVAHDFNNLLTVISGNLELLEFTHEEHGIESEELTHVRAAAKRASDLTHSLLAFSRRQSLAPEYLDIRALVDGMVGLLRRTLPESIRVEALVDDEIWGAHVDRSLLENAILNLALNARDAMKGGGILGLVAANVDLDADTAAAFDVAPGRYVSISVTDTGEGMPAEVVDQVFEPFFTTKPQGEGTGLGLSMVYGFVRQTGGGIRVRSVAGTGTEIDLLFPFAQAPADAPLGMRERPQRHGDGRAVLVVEDETAVRELVVSMLGRLGYAARAAATGEEALRMFDEERPDLVVSDVVLAGGMTGVDVVNAVRARDARFPALFMSGYSDAVFRNEEHLPEGVDLLSKPFGIDELAAQLRALAEAPAVAATAS
jgi:PAS domain S-box-containing protein